MNNTSKLDEKRTYNKWAEILAGCHETTDPQAYKTYVELELMSANKEELEFINSMNFQEKLAYALNARGVNLNRYNAKEEKKEDKAPLDLGERERELLNLENESKEITSLRLDLTESEREAIHYLFELEKDRRNNGNEWTDKEKAHAQKALDTLTDLGILDTFPNLQDFEPSLEDLDQFKFYKSESFYEGGYLPTSQAIEFLELTYQEIIDHDKVMALLQIPLNVLNVTEFIEVLKYNILRVHLKQGYQYQGSSFIDTTVGQYQAFDISNNLQEQGSLFDFENLSFEELENALFDVDEELDRFECIEEKTFSNNHHYHNVPYDKAKQLAQQVAEVTTGTTKDKLLDKRIRITKAIEQLSQLNNKDVLRL